MKALLFLVLAACTADVPANHDPDLDSDADLQTILEDPMPETAAVDADTVDMPPVTADARLACTKTRFLHVANFSFVANLSEC
ncbi:MAG: hypothetical protein JO112_08130, partial [Planctomycetes bacterium]|nr:hypothetical protein [Planctomycetota bacterium]